MAGLIRRFNLWLLRVLDSNERVTVARLAISVLLTLALFGGWVPLQGRSGNGFRLLTAFGTWAKGDLISATFFMLFGLGLVLAMSAALRLMRRQAAQGNRGRGFYLSLGAMIILALWLLLWSGTRTALGMIAPGLCMIVSLANFLLILYPARLLRRFLDAALYLTGFCFIALSLWILGGTGGEGGSGPGFWLALLGLLGCGLVEYAAYLQEARSPAARV